MKKMKKKGWFSLIYLLAISAGFYWVSPAPAMERVLTPSGSYLNIGPAELAAMLEKKDFLFANVHIPYEGEIAETDTHIPFNKYRGELGKISSRKGREDSPLLSKRPYERRCQPDPGTPGLYQYLEPCRGYTSLGKSWLSFSGRAEARMKVTAKGTAYL